MPKLKEEYNSFLKDIENNIKDKDDLKYIKNRFSKFLDVVLEQMDYIIDYKEAKMEELEKTQRDINSKMEKMEQVINNIEKDIYSEDVFDFDIICPYCDY